MKQLTCEICGSTDVMKQDGVFICQTCGCKYSAEDVKRMIIEGTVDVSGSTIKVDNTSHLDNLYKLSRRLRDEKHPDAPKYYEMILIEDPTSWEATFYIVYCKAIHAPLNQIAGYATKIITCSTSALDLIKNNINNQDAQCKAYSEIADKVYHLANHYEDLAENYYEKAASYVKPHIKEIYIDRALDVINLYYNFGTLLADTFETSKKAQELAARAWKKGALYHSQLLPNLSNKKYHKDAIASYVTKINNSIPDNFEIDYPSSGCYVATCVYGSYDCPQVWTLRRYRDFTLAKTWYGRAFIRTYYAISPTLVKWFGHTEWFKNTWKPYLDRMVKKLNSIGFEDTPYKDKHW